MTEYSFTTCDFVSTIVRPVRRFGRTTLHRPEQRSGETLKYTTYNYNPDDSILNITDGRGVVTNYIYNSRGLVEVSR